MSCIVEVNNVSFSYYGSSRKVLNNCSLQVHPGELISILGPNGAGKSTLLNCACNLLTPQGGEVIVDGNKIKNLSLREIAKVIGYVQQYQSTAFAYTVFDYVLMGRASNIGLFRQPSTDDRKKVTEILESMGISYLTESSITEISGGERQQCAIARAVAQDPKVIFFDEPTAHLDFGNQIKTLQLISSLREKGYAVIMTTHNPDHCLMLGGTVAILDKEGNLETGQCDKIMTEDRLKRVYNTDLRLVYINEIQREACVPCGLVGNGDLL